MEHPAFENVGQEPGIHIWTIDKFEPVPIEQQMYGKFYNGDSYIVLKTTGDDNATLTHDAHFWLGDASTQDKRGAAAILTVTLDDMLSGGAVHHRELQGHESPVFLSYFKPAIRYLEGGLESGFNQVETNAGAEKRLLKLSGCDNMRISEVPAEPTSLNRESCFILELDHDIFVLMPQTAKATQRRKIIQVANTLRDDYHNGRATIEIIDEFSDDDDWARFFEAIGSGSCEDIADDSGSEDFGRGGTVVYLFKVLLGDDLELEAAKLKQQSLSSTEMFILDTPDSGIYVWIGSALDTEQKNNYAEVAQNYLTLKGYPTWMHITRVSEGRESNDFKQYFDSWSTLTPRGKTVNNISDSVNSSEAKLIGKSAAASGYMPEGDGNISITKISQEAQSDVTDILGCDYAVLYSAHVYIVTAKYAADGGDAHVVYAWVGSSASGEDVQAAIQLVSDLEDELGTPVTSVKVPQGKEPKHFLSLFKGNLIVLMGAEGEPDNSNNNYQETKIRLFQVKGTQPGVDTRALQVLESAESLEDDDVFVLETADKVYVRFGKESDEIENEAAENIGKLLAENNSSLVLEPSDEGRELVTFQQGEEPTEFWEALGGEPEEKTEKSGWQKAVNRRVHSGCNLTAVTVKLSGKIVFEDLSSSYSQEDLSDDGIYILDTGDELFVWRGQQLPERVRQALPRVVEEYIADDGLERTVQSALVVSVRRGQEPDIFQKLFPTWDADMWDNQTSYEEIKNQVKAGNE